MCSGMVSNFKYTHKRLRPGRAFETSRILVIGRPQIGKSSLIRFLLGLPLSDEQCPDEFNGDDITEECSYPILRDEGSGDDITEEWSHPILRLKIHECNVAISPPEVDDPNASKWKSTGRRVAHVKEVEKFFKARQKKPDFSDRIHVVLYLISALDELNATNAKVLKAIGKYEQLPILLIVTHKHLDPRGGGYFLNVEEHLDQLLEHVSDKERVMADIVKVGNFYVNNQEIDWKALNVISFKTQQHLDSEQLKSAWTVARADFQEKIYVSARAIVGFKEGAIYGSPAGLIPGAHQLIVGSLLASLCRDLYNIWGVPGQFRDSLNENFISPEVFAKQMNLLVRKFEAVNRGAAEVGTAIFNAIPPEMQGVAKFGHDVMNFLPFTRIIATAAAGVVGWIHASRNDSYDSMIIIVSLGIMVSGAILYVKGISDPRGWDETKSKNDYDKLIEEFVHLHGPDLKQYVVEHHSCSDIFNPENDRQQVVSCGSFLTGFDA